MSNQADRTLGDWCDGILSGTITLRELAEYFALKEDELYSLWMDPVTTERRIYVNDDWFAITPVGLINLAHVYCTNKHDLNFSLSDARIYPIPEGWLTHGK